MSNFIKNILKSFIVGPIISASCYSNGVSTTLTSCGLIIAIIIGLIDSILYGIGFYLSIQTMNELHDQRISVHKDFRSIIIKEKQLLQPTIETVDLLIRTQKDLYDLIKDLVQDNTTNQELIQNSLNKLTTLEFIQKDSVMTIKKNVNDGLQLIHTDFNNSILADSDLFNRIYFYICTFSFLLYIHQIILWFLQYLTLKNPKKYSSYSFILSIIILSQSLGLMHFFHIINILAFLSPLYIYTWIFFIRSLMSIYQYAFSDY
jgi:hypothetical protein